MLDVLEQKNRRMASCNKEESSGYAGAESNCGLLQPTTINDEDDNNLVATKSDSLGRLQSSLSSSKGGRGSLVGWTRCPLCLRNKVFAKGRGIATHFQQVHTPWKPGKAEKRRRRLKQRHYKRQKLENMESSNELQNLPAFQMDHWFVNRPKNGDEVDWCWEPTPAERQQWDEQVLAMVQTLDNLASSHRQSTYIGLDRNGQPAQSYRDSLPPLHAAAAKGDIVQLKKILATPEIDTLLQSRDRNGSYAEHWAAGEGHLECLRYLLSLKQNVHQNNQEGESFCENNPAAITAAAKGIQPKNKPPRRRDGKTCLHYASRFGRLAVVKYLVDISYSAIDDPSGEGTTAFHLACFGAFPETARFLKEHGADPTRCNEWNCQATHWVAMHKCDQDEAAVADEKDGSASRSGSGKTMQEKPNVLAVCRFLKDECGLNFCAFQKQGHCALHKAAQAKNYDAIRWMCQTLTASEKSIAGQPDKGGHVPSDILASVGGCEDFARWMKESHGW